MISATTHILVPYQIENRKSEESIVSLQNIKPIVTQTICFYQIRCSVSQRSRPLRGAVATRFEARVGVTRARKPVPVAWIKMRKISCVVCFSLGNRMLSEKLTSDAPVDFSIDPKHEVKKKKKSLLFVKNTFCHNVKKNSPIRARVDTLTDFKSIIFLQTARLCRAASSSFFLASLSFS